MNDMALTDAGPRLFDVHSHWGTERGYPLRNEESRALQKMTFASEARYETEDDMAAYFRQNRVRAILDFGFTKVMAIEEASTYHDYAMATQRVYPDVIFGNWLQIDPRTGAAGAREMRRCIDQRAGFIGLCVSAAGMGYPASDPIYEPFYRLCLEARRPVLVLVFSIRFFTICSV